MVSKDLREELLQSIRVAEYDLSKAARAIEDAREHHDLAKASDMLDEAISDINEAIEAINDHDDEDDCQCLECQDGGMH